MSAVPIPGSASVASRSTWLFSWPLLAGMVAYLIALARGNRLLLDGDTYSHVTIGQWMLQHGEIPAQDHFSHTMRGAAWTAHEWLSQVVLGAVQQAAGWTGAVGLTALAFAVTIALLTRALLRRLEPIHVLLFVSLAVLMTISHVLVRPHMLAMPLMMIWMTELVRASEDGESPGLWMLPMLVLWANLHASFTLGLAIAFAFALEALLAARQAGRVAQAARSWGIFLALAIGCSLVTPHGPHGIWMTWQVMVEDSFAMERIGEWRSPDFHSFQPLELWLLGGVAVALHQGLKLPLVRLLLLLGLLHLALKHIRYVELVGLLAPLFLASPLAAQWRERQQGKQQLAGADRVFQKLAHPAGAGAVLVSGLACLVALLWVSRASAIAPPETVAPAQAVRAAQQAGLKGPVLNGYLWGGYLIHVGVPPFIDGRSDMYRDAFIRDYLAALELKTSDGLEKLLAKHAIEWTLLPPETSAIALLDRMPGWRRVHTDGVAVVHARTTTAK